MNMYFSLCLLKIGIQISMFFDIYELPKIPHFSYYVRGFVSETLSEEDCQTIRQSNIFVCTENCYLSEDSFYSEIVYILSYLERA